MSSRNIALVSASVVLVFGLVVFLNYLLKAPLTVQVGEATSIDIGLSPGESGSLRDLSGAGQGQVQGSQPIKRGLADQRGSWVPGSDPRGIASNSDYVSARKGGPVQSLDRLTVAQTRQMLSAYTRSLQLRAAQAGIPPHLAARLSAEVASVAVSTQVAGANPAQTIATTRLFGETALSSSLRVQQKLLFISTANTGTVGGRTGQFGAPPAGVRNMTQVLKQQQKQQAIHTMIHSQQ